jgi:hypothetical protein
MKPVAIPKAKNELQPAKRGSFFKTQTGTLRRIELKRKGFSEPADKAADID